MSRYRCYLLDAQFRISAADVFDCCGDDDAKRRGREILTRNFQAYRAVEVWNDRRRVYLYPADEVDPAYADRTPRSLAEPA